MRYQQLQLRLQFLTDKTARKLRAKGVFATLARAGEILFSKIVQITKVSQEPQRDAFDLARGTDTSGIVPLWKLIIKSPNARYGVNYEATSENAIKDAIRFLNVDPSHTVFVDLGCGKGRPLIVAAELHFREIIGVEFATELVETARANLKHLGIGASVHHCDAAEFDFPAKPLVVFLYNPFGAEVLAKVVERLRGHDFDIIYYNPQHAEILDRANFLQKIDGAPNGFMMWHSLSQ